MIDFHLNSGVAVLTRDIDYVLQQIDMLFDTDPNEVLGDISYGTRYDKYLYNLNASNEAIRSKVMSDLNGLDMKGFSFDVDVKFLEGTQRDIALIDIILNRDYESHRRIYKIFGNYENI